MNEEDYVLYMELRDVKICEGESERKYIVLFWEEKEGRGRFNTVIRDWKTPESR